MLADIETRAGLPQRIHRAQQRRRLTVAPEGSVMPSAPAPALRYPEGAYADVPGACLYYIDTGGSGVPVVFMHAATGSSQSWEHQIPVCAATSAAVARRSDHAR